MRKGCLFFLETEVAQCGPVRQTFCEDMMLMERNQRNESTVSTAAHLWTRILSTLTLADIDVQPNKEKVNR